MGLGSVSRTITRLGSVVGAIMRLCSVGREIIRLGSVSGASQWAQMLKALVA
jgi:hypothetical protein